MTDDELKRVAISAALQNDCHCPAYALDAAIANALPYVSVTADGTVVATGTIRANGTAWVPTTGDTPRTQYDMTGQARTLPLPIAELIKELAMCPSWPGRWKAVGAPL